MSEEAKNFRFLWHSVAGSIRSGYGNLTRHICSRLVAKGYQIIVSAYYGLEPGGMILINGVPHIPSKIGNFGEISALEHVKNYKINASILTTDFWAFGWFPEKMVYPILHSPMDHENYNRFILDMVKKYEKVCAFCRWQQSELKKE